MYIKIASWHIIRTWTRVPNVALTLCGKRATGEAADSFGGERSCETCLRIAAKVTRVTFGTSFHVLWATRLGIQPVCWFRMFAWVQ